jgi:cytochrome c peroxidase
MVGREQQILTMLRDDSKYRQMFAAAFGESQADFSRDLENPSPNLSPTRREALIFPPSLQGKGVRGLGFTLAFPHKVKSQESQDTISLSNLTKALAAFERTLISVNSPYDRYRFGGDSHAISKAAKRGEKLFNSERLECFHCHGGINFSDSVMHDRLAFVEIAFHNTGLYNIDGKGAYPPDNTGVYEITTKPSDMGRFKAPTLRNIALTAPYMHDGSIPTLEAVIDHYKAGGRTIHTGNFAGVGSKNPFKSEFISGFELTEAEKNDLIAFLKSLTDEIFIHNPAFSNPNLINPNSGLGTSK